MNDKKHKLVILQLAGFGDTLSLITRMPAMLEAYPKHEPIFYLGGYGKSPHFSKEQLEREGYEAKLIKNLTFHNQLTQMRDFLKTKVCKEGDIFLDVSFCEEIFDTRVPEFHKYPLQFPYEYKTGAPTEEVNSIVSQIKEKNGVAIHPLTKDGNAEGFQSDVDNGRFWKKEFWEEICELLHEKDFTPTFVGINDEDWDLREYCDKRKIPYIDAMGVDVENTIHLLKNVAGCIACNSWDWEITSRLNIPTIVFYTKNHFFIKNHTPPANNPFWNTCYIETNCVQTAKATIPGGTSSLAGRVMKGQEEPSEVFDKFYYLYKNRRRPDVQYSVCMITYNDEECVRDTMENVIPYVTDDFVITDGGSTDKTISIIEEYSASHQLGMPDVNLIHKKWADNFEIQKNNPLDAANQEWRIWIDADEIYEPIFWNQLPWYIRDAEGRGVDCVNIPRINTVEGITQEFADMQVWNLSYFNWINYPDYQQRIFKSYCRFAGRTHERIINVKKDAALVGVHCMHPKSMEIQKFGIQREKDQYKIEAQKVKENVNIGFNKKLVVHYLHHLGIGGTAKVVQLLCKSFMKMDKKFHHVLAYKAHGELEREPFFEEILGRENLISFASVPEFYEILREIKPFIMHRQTSGQPEMPFVPPIIEQVKHTISTAIFGHVDESIPLSRVIYISNHMQHCAGIFRPDVRLIGIPVEAPLTNEDLREELDIPKNAFVFGRIGRDDNDIYDPVNLISFAEVEDENTYFVALAPSDFLKNKATELGVNNIRYVDKTLDDVRISKFYNTLNVLAHSRKDGECNPGNIWEGFSHGKPVVSHYGIPYNGHIQEIGNCGFVIYRKDNFHNVWQNLNPSSIPDILEYSRSIGVSNFTCEDSSNSIKNNQEEYTRIMRAFIDNTIDYNTMSKNCVKRWEKQAKPELIAKQHLDLYEELL